VIGVRLSDMISPLRHPPFRRQFLAQAIETVGSALAPVALAFGVLAATDSAAALGLVLAAYSIPMLVLMVVGGVWADRLPRQLLIMFANLVRAVTQTTFGVLLLIDQAPLWAMVVLQAISGSAVAFARPAMLGLTKATAPPDSRQQANALLALTGDLAFIVGPLIAGALTVTVGAGWALIVDGVSFLGSALLLAGLRLPPVTRTPSNFLAELREGWRAVASREWLWASVIYFAFFNAVFAIFQVVAPAQLASEPTGALSWGAISAGLSIGTLCGNALALRLRPRLLLRWARLLELLVLPLVVALALGAPVAVLIAGAFLMGLSISFPDALWYTALQQEVPDEMLSRVSSFDYLGSFISRPIGYAFAGFLVAAGTEASLLAVGAVLAVVTLATMASPGVRNLVRREEPPTGRAPRTGGLGTEEAEAAGAAAT
jgi:MFS family permease